MDAGQIERGMQLLVAGYIAMVMIMMFVGALYIWVFEEPKTGARLILVAVVWPLLIPFVIWKMAHYALGIEEKREVHARLQKQD